MTTEQLLVAFDPESFNEMPDREQLADAGVIARQMILAAG